MQFSSALPLILASVVASATPSFAASSDAPMRIAAADTTDPRSMTGKEKKPHRDTLLVSPPLPKSTLDPLLAKMHRIRDIVLATPTLRSLRGYDWATFDSLKNDYRAAFPLAGRVSYIAYPLGSFKGKIQSSEEGPPFVIHLNEPEAVLGSNGYNVNKAAGYTIPPAIVGELNGYPVYEEEFVVMTKDRRPLFVPVTEGEYLQHLFRDSQRELADMRKRFAAEPEDPGANQYEIDGRTKAIEAARAENEARWAQMQSKWPDRVAAERARFDEKERKLLAEVEELKTTTPRQRFLKPFETRLAALEAEIAGLTEAQKASAARFPDGKTTRASGLAEAGSASKRTISRLNPALFDSGKPKHSIQLITLGTTRYFPEAYRQVHRELDLGALASLLE